jgi:hypothetical protein
MFIGILSWVNCLASPESKMFFSEHVGFSTREAVQAPSLVSVGTSQLFSGLDWAVIALGYRDDRLSIMARKGWRWRLVSLAVAPAPALANVRLEALRQLVVALRLSTPTEANRAIALASENGLSAEQIAAIRGLFA